ncbi:MAG TPA: hypothetical protein VJS64_00390 [Pyrinomonadaceae bacterium]|nr:hypothetical protein [Pyrinomonadaceae bacterium]
MKATIKELEPASLDAYQWRRAVIDNTFSTIDGRAIEYQGDALISEAAQSHSLEFEFKTHTVSPAHLQIPLSVSVPATARLRVNGQLVGTFDLAASKDRAPLLHSLAANVSNETQPHRISRLRLRLSYGEQAGRATILLGDDDGEQRPKVLQQWSWRYALQPLAFFILAWGTILGLAILVFVNIRSFGDTFRFYGVITMIAAWGCSVLGISDLAKIPFWSLLRKLYGKTRRYRAVSLTTLTLLFVVVSAGTAAVVYCLRIHQNYSNLIFKAMAMNDGPDRDETITRAFVLSPWRKEAQSLFERRAWTFRNNDMTAFREHIRKFVSRPDVKQAVLQASSFDELPLYFDTNSNSAFGDPVVWYASLLPEADEDKEYSFTQMAVAILSKNKTDDDAEAKILLTVLRLGFAQREKRKKNASEEERVQKERLEGEIVNELRGLLTQYNTFKDAGATQTYQVGCDMLACYYIVHCQPKDASQWFDRELKARDHQQTATSLPLWQRPPEKLRLYHMFHMHKKASGTNVEAADADLDSEGIAEKCREAKTNDEIARCLLDWDDHGKCESPYKKEFEVTIFPSHDKKYQDEAAWLKGTVLEPGKLETLINTLLIRGWRY